MNKWGAEVQRGTYLLQVESSRKDGDIGRALKRRSRRKDVSAFSSRCVEEMDSGVASVRQ